MLGVDIKDEIESILIDTVNLGFPIVLISFPSELGPDVVFKVLFELLSSLELVNIAPGDEVSADVLQFGMQVVVPWRFRQVSHVIEERGT